MMSRRKRILVVTRSTVAHSGSGGMEVVVDDLLRNLSEEDFELGLLTTFGADKTILSDVFTKVWTVPGSRAGKYSLRWWTGSASASSEWAEWKPDLIFSVSSAATSFALSSNWADVPIVAQCHGTAWYEVKSSLSALSVRELVKIPLNLSRITRERLAYRRFQLTVAVGPGVAQQLLGLPLRVPRGLVQTIANSVDSDTWRFRASGRQSARANLQIPNDVPVAIFTGRLHRQKGADLALEALSRVSDTSWHMVICGDGPEKDRLHQLTVSLGLESRVHFTGSIDRHDLPDLLSAADLMVFPTRRSEGLPMNVLEGLAAGLDVLTTHNANLPSDICQRVIISDMEPDRLAAKWNVKTKNRMATPPLPVDYLREGASEKYKMILQHLGRSRPT
jgi:glycosyltransferase involved in cell wall biosynthesis